MGAEWAVTPDPAILYPGLSNKAAALRARLLDGLCREPSIVDFNHGVGDEPAGRQATGVRMSGATPLNACAV